MTTYLLLAEAGPRNVQRRVVPPCTSTGILDAFLRQADALPALDVVSAGIDVESHRMRVEVAARGNQTQLTGHLYEIATALDISTLKVEWVDVE